MMLHFIPGGKAAKTTNWWHEKQNKPPNDKVQSPKHSMLTWHLSYTALLSQFQISFMSMFKSLNSKFHPPPKKNVYLSFSSWHFLWFFPWLFGILVFRLCNFCDSQTKECLQNLWQNCHKTSTDYRTVQLWTQAGYYAWVGQTRNGTSGLLRLSPCPTNLWVDIKLLGFDQPAYQPCHLQDDSFSWWMHFISSISFLFPTLKVPSTDGRLWRWFPNTEYMNFHYKWVSPPSGCTVYL